MIETVTDPDTLEETLPLNYMYGDVFKKQVGGNHYLDYSIPPGVYNEENGLSFWESCVVKYVTRYKEKQGLEDLRKAKNCLELLAARHYGEKL